MTTSLEILTVFSALFLFWWLLRKMLRPKAPAEPAEEPFAFAPVPRGSKPKGRSGAVALEEPGEDDPADAFPPRKL